jgi:opacity protein-like surface antigen
VALGALGMAAAASADVGPLVPATTGTSPFTPGCQGVDQNGRKYHNTEPEPWIDVDPTSVGAVDGADLIGTQQQDRFETGGANGLGTSISGNGASSWTQLGVAQLPDFDLCMGATPGGPDDYERASDPWVSNEPVANHAWQISIAFNDTRDLANAVTVSHTTDDGATWGPVIALKRDEDPNVFNDKESITADYTRTGHVYAVWDRLIFPKEKSGGQSFEHAAAFRGPIWFSKTENDSTWSSRQLFDPGQNDQTIGNQIVVMPDGDLVNAFTQFSNDNRGGRKGGLIRVIRSDDAGDSWSSPITVARLGAIGVEVPDSTFDDDADPEPVRTSDFNAEVASDERAGTDNVYAVWQDARFNGFERDQIAFSKSTDGGETWSTPVRINRDPSTQAFTPAIRVDDQGNIGVTYYDLRNDDPETYAVETDLWFIRSADGGQTWSERVTPDSFDLRAAPIARGYFLGDYQGLIAYGDKFVAYSTLTNPGFGDAVAVEDDALDTSNRTDVFSATIEPPFPAAAAATFSASKRHARVKASAFPRRKVKPRLKSQPLPKRYRHVHWGRRK